jgi:hypothetical protein
MIFWRLAAQTGRVPSHAVQVSAYNDHQQPATSSQLCELQPGSLAPSTSIRSIDGACASKSGAFAPSAFAIGPSR